CTGKLAEPEFMKPRPDACQRAHETAGAHQLPARSAACRQIPIKVLLVQFVRVQKPVCGPCAEGGVVDVFAQHSSTLLFAASEEVSAEMMLGLRLVRLILLG